MRSTSALTAVVVSVVFTVLSILAVLLRQYAQSLKRNTWTIEAGFLIAAVVRVVYVW
jgi:Na+-transporting methylmalonyl-CoA/oxaloacetate decarboxylase gamma subunit